MGYSLLVSMHSVATSQPNSMYVYFKIGSTEFHGTNSQINTNNVILNN